MKQRIWIWFGGLSFKSKLLTVFIPLNPHTAVHFGIPIKSNF
ncbi:MULTISPECIES: hypothetical protein [Paenibacillus]|nr:hypothetical protein [Paenibacillus sp. oral taxon 786]